MLLKNNGVFIKYYKPLPQAGVLWGGFVCKPVTNKNANNFITLKIHEKNENIWDYD